MPERTIKAVFYNYVDSDGQPRTAYRNDEVDFTEKEAARGDALGAFVGSGNLHVTDAKAAAFGNTGRVGGVHTNVGSVPEREDGGTGGESTDGLLPSAMTDEQIDQLGGERLDEAIAQTDIDPSTGGSLADGSLSADEKRAALKQLNADD